MNKKMKILVIGIVVGIVVSGGMFFQSKKEVIDLSIAYVNTKEEIEEAMPVGNIFDKIKNAGLRGESTETVGYQKTDAEEVTYKILDDKKNRILQIEINILGIDVGLYIDDEKSIISFPMGDFYLEQDTVIEMMKLYGIDIDVPDEYGKNMLTYSSLEELNEIVPKKLKELEKDMKKELTKQLSSKNFKGEDSKIMLSSGEVVSKKYVLEIPKEIKEELLGEELLSASLDSRILNNADIQIEIYEYNRKIVQLSLLTTTEESWNRFSIKSVGENILDEIKLAYEEEVSFGTYKSELVIENKIERDKRIETKVQHAYQYDDEEKEVTDIGTINTKFEDNSINMIIAFNIDKDEHVIDAALKVEKEKIFYNMKAEFLAIESSMKINKLENPLTKKEKPEEEFTQEVIQRLIMQILFGM